MEVGHRTLRLADNVIHRYLTVNLETNQKHNFLFMLNLSATCFHQHMKQDRKPLTGSLLLWVLQLRSG
jgi:hypothetical protein